MWYWLVALSFPFWVAVWSLVFGFSSFFVGLGVGLFVVVVNSVAWLYFTFCVVNVWLL